MNKNALNYTINIDTEITKALKGAKDLKDGLSAAQEAGKASGTKENIASIEKALAQLRERASQPLNTLGDQAKLQKDAQTAISQLQKVGKTIQSLKDLDGDELLDLLPSELANKFSSAGQAVVTFADKIKAAKEKSEELVAAEKKLTTAKEELANANAQVTKAETNVSLKQKRVTEAQEAKKAIEDQIAAIKKFQ